ncbi:MAG: acetoin utilization protein AcuC, partial [Gammaproteobacteria bacterium]
MELSICLGDELGRYHFGADHPFGPLRYPAFLEAFEERGLGQHCVVRSPRQAMAAVIERFHTPAYVERVRDASATGWGYLDYGDTPAVPGIYEAAAFVVGSVIDALGSMLAGELRRAFVPIAGLHHARRNRAAGFCVFNDCGVAIETAMATPGIERIAYVDIDAHHGDGVFYAFESDPRVIVADTHQDGRTLYPGTGDASETGRGEAKDTKLNIPLPPGASDKDFFAAWPRIEAHLERFEPQLILFQCGVDSLAGDPITALQLSEQAHAHAA